jgi:hypothetical protein
MKLLFIFFFLFTGVTMAIEEPEFTVMSKTSSYEIRKYGPIIVAETKVEANFEDAGNQAFRILAGYIFGGNKSKTKIAMTAPVNQMSHSLSEKIAMTAPVTMNKSNSGFIVQFTMPKNYTTSTLPIPDDPRVEIRQIPVRTVAVFTYSGSWSESRYQSKLEEFKNELKKNAVKIMGEPVLARFNSPFQLWFLRRNEIWIEIGE